MPSITAEETEDAEDAEGQTVLNLGVLRVLGGRNYTHLKFTVASTSVSG